MPDQQAAGPQYLPPNYPYQALQEQEVVSVKPRGKYTYPNNFSAVPQGALTQALNVVMPRPFVIEQRRGEAPVGPVLADNVNKLYNYQNQIIMHHGMTLSYYSSDLSTRTDYAGSYAPPTNALVIRGIQSNKNIYFLTSTGVKKLDLITNAIKSSGAPAGLDGSGTTTGSGWFTNNTQVAYRILFGYTDANSNLILGAPSQRIVVSNNSGGATNVSLTFTLPSGMDTTWQYQIYRSPMSVDLNTEPNDECALVFTGNPTSGQLSAGTITLTDSINDSLKGPFIYTASSQQGIAQANYQSPIGTDTTVFKGFTFVANTTSKQTQLLTLVSVGGAGLVNGDTVTLSGTTYTGQATENIATNQFQIFTAGTPSQNITNTSNSLVRVINRSASNTSIYAYYSSGYADLPGKITLQERGIGAGSFTSASSRAGAFVPDIGTTTATSSTNNLPNGISVSKFQQPEAFPLGQVLRAGSADKSILRILALRDYILIFKQDGVYQIVGSDIGSFAVQEVDVTMILRGIETAVVLNNKVYFFSNPTICSMTFSEGAVLKALPVKAELLILASPLYPNFDTASYGIAYESENSYIFGTVSNTTDTIASQYYVYNYLTDNWTNWQYPFLFNTGFVNPTDNKLYFGSADAGSRFLYQERKNYTSADFGDNSYPVTISSSSGLSVVVNSTAGLQVGWKLQQADRKSIITAIPDSTHLTVTDNLAWTAGAALVYTPIAISLQFVPEHAGNPGLVKHFKECHSIFSNADFTSFKLGFFTDFYDNIDSATLVPKTANSSGWGSGQWGLFPWGGGVPQAQVIRGWVPLNQRRGHWLNMVINYSDALTNFAFDGFILFYQSSSQKFH
jgi:hypothetical protein